MYLSGHFRSIARKALRGFWALTIGVTLVAALLGSGVDFASGSASGGRITHSYQDPGEYYNVSIETPGFSMSRTFLNTPAITHALTIIVPVITVLAVIQLLFGGAIELGENRYCIDLLTREHEPEFKTLFSRFSIFGKALGLRILTSIFTVLWMLLLIVPGIIAVYRYALAPYLMAEDPEMGAMEAIEKSKELMKGNKWRLFCLQMSFFGWILLSVLTLDILSLWIRPYMNVATAAFYLEVTGRADMMPKPEA